MKFLQWIHWRQVQLKILPLPSFTIICSPSLPLVFLSFSLLSFTVRKDYLWRDNSVPSCTGKDGGPQTLLQWVTLTAGGNCKDKIWVLVFFDAAARSWADLLFQLLPHVVWICKPRTWPYLPWDKCRLLGVYCATVAPNPGASLFALCLSHVFDTRAWIMRAIGIRGLCPGACICELLGGERWLPTERPTSRNSRFFCLGHFCIARFKEIRIRPESPCQKWCFALLTQPITTQLTSFGRTNM